MRFEVAVKLSQLKDEVEGRTLDESILVKFGTLEGKDGATHGVWCPDHSKP